ncbi:MAG: hypothetical protein RL094_311 [Candidatus Parcubacteria bacterium]|jgi:hypothetical protein
MSRITNVTAVAGDQLKTVEQLTALHPLVEHPKGFESKYKVRVARRKENGRPNFITSPQADQPTHEPIYDWYRTLVILRSEKVHSKGDTKVPKLVHLKPVEDSNPLLYLPNFYTEGVRNSEVSESVAYIQAKLHIIPGLVELVKDLTFKGEESLRVAAMVAQNFSGRVASGAHVKLMEHSYTLQFEPLTKELIAGFNIVDLDVLLSVVTHLAKHPDYKTPFRGLKTAIAAAKKVRAGEARSTTKAAA